MILGLKQSMNGRLITTTLNQRTRYFTPIISVYRVCKLQDYETLCVIRKFPEINNDNECHWVVYSPRL